MADNENGTYNNDSQNMQINRTPSRSYNKNSATNLNEDSYESGIFYEIEEALREAGLNPVRFNENGIMTNNIGWTVRGEDGTEQQITCDGSYLDDEEINQ